MIEIIPEVPATTTTPGTTQGKRCTVCGEWIEEPQPIPVSGYSIKYYLNNTYIESLNPQNDNSTAFSANESVSLVYTYGFESDYDPSSYNVSDVVEWVQYRMK